MANYDAFYRRMSDLAVMIGQAERHAEALGFNNSAIKLQDMRASVNKIASNVMTKIEAEHIARMERRKDLTKRILAPSSQTPGSAPCGGQQLDVPQLVSHAQASGLNVVVIDENTDFSTLTLPGLTRDAEKCDPAPSVESPQCDPAPPSDQQ